MQTPFVFIYITVPSVELTKHIASTLLNENLIACANFWPMQSLYRWEGQSESSEEYILLLKTQAFHYESIVKRVSTLHPYEVPCITKLYAEPNGLFGAWIMAETGIR